MNNPGAFLDEILGFNAEEIPEQALVNTEGIIAQPFFNYDTMKGKSTAAAYLTNWVVNIVAYNRIYKKVAPLMAQVKEATETKEAAEAALAIVLATKEVETGKLRLKKATTETKLLAEDAQRDLNRVMPTLEAAADAVEKLDKRSICEVKAYAKPPELVA